MNDTPSERVGWETVVVQPYPTPPRIGYAPSLGAAVRQAQANLRRGERTTIRRAIGSEMMDVSRFGFQ